LVALLDRFAPLRTYNRREANSLIWFNDAVLSAIQDRNRAYRATQVIRSAKRCFSGRFLDLSGNPKKIWCNIR
jgi:hypothetical protein